TDPFGCRCLTITTLLRFHFPLIEPDVRICRIRLSDQVSYVRTRVVERPPLEAKQPQLAMQLTVGMVLPWRPLLRVLPPQPLTQPTASVRVHAPIGFRDCPQTEIVHPALE